MIYGSVCSGIEAASVAWHPLGWKPSFFSEIEPYPCAALAHHYPGVSNFGDMTRFKEWPDADINVLVGGTPCQAFSVAGLRAGLADPRGNLTLTFLALVERYRPKWVVWENVPGVLSDRTGAFGSLVGGLAELGYGWAYRILDAQYFGLAQRRKRVFVVASARGWASAAAVLFESESLRGHPAPSRETREKIAASPAGRPDRGGGNGEVQRVVTHALRAEGFDASEDGTGRGIPIIAHCLNAGGMGRIDAESETLIPAPAHCFDARQSSVVQYGNLAGPLDTDGHSQAVVGATSVRRLTPRECERLQGFPLIAERIIIDLCIDQANIYAVVDLRCLRWHSSVSPADGGDLTPFASSAEVDSSIGQAVRAPLAAVHVLPLSEGEGAQIRSQGRWLSNANGASAQSWCHQRTLNVDTARSLALTLRELAHSVRSGKAASRLHMLLSTGARNGDKPAPIFGGATGAGASDAMSGQRSVTFTTSELGRLTPISDSREATLCCSVMAVIAGSIPSETLPARFSLELTVVTPYTAIPYRGKPAADGPRYKALGNSMAVPVMRWIGERITMIEGLSPGLGAVTPTGASHV